MAQKTNPTALRIQSGYKSFNSSWYSDFFYNESLLHEQRIHHYLKNVLAQTGLTGNMITSVEQYRRGHQIVYFFDQRGERYQLEYALGLSRQATRRTNTVNSANTSLGTEKIEQAFAGGRSRPQSRTNVTPTTSTTRPPTLPYSPLLSPTLPYGVDRCGATHSRKLPFAVQRDLSFRGVTKNIKLIADRETIPKNSIIALKRVLSPITRAVGASIQTNLQTDPRQSIHCANIEQGSTLLSPQRAQNRELEFYVPKLRTLVGGLQTRGTHNSSSLAPVHSTRKRPRTANHSFRERGGMLARSKESSLVIMQNHLCNTYKRVHPSTIPIINRVSPLIPANASSMFTSIAYRTLLCETITPIRMMTAVQGADYLVDLIALFLQRKVSFRKVKDIVFRLVSAFAAVKGVRITLSGRSGGRSKKAQKSRTQTAQWGSTSLTVWSSHLSFANRSINTQAGVIGLKLWICYKLST